MLDTRCWMLDAGYSILDAGFSILPKAEELKKLAAFPVCRYNTPLILCEVTFRYVARVRPDGYGF